MQPPTLIGLPYDAGSSFLRGAAEAPARIREALHSPATNGWSERGVDVLARLRDAGDLELASAPDPRAAIRAGIERVMETGRPVALGGDHSVTHPVLRAVRAACPRLTVLHLDAHSDLYPDFDGDPFSHASPFARVLEEGLADRLVQVGIRTLNGVQREQAERYGVEVLDMRRWAAGERFTLDGPVYLSLDLDVIDPAFAPGVSHREPGGLSVREVIGLLQALDAPLVGADLVEFNPGRDPAGISGAVCAKLVKEVVDQMLRIS